MDLISDKDVLGLVDHLCLASTTPLSSNKQKKLYWLMNTAVTHLETIQDDHRIANIRATLLQNLTELDPNILEQLSHWLRTHSKKKVNGELCGAIVPFQKIFGSRSKLEETTQILTQESPLTFSIISYINRICDAIEENHTFETTDEKNAINQPSASSFSQLLGPADIRKSQFVEFDVLKALYLVSKKDRENVTNDCIDQINQGNLSNLSLNLNSVPDLRRFFGEKYQKLTRLDFKYNPDPSFPQEKHQKQTEDLLLTLKELPLLTHLSLDSYYFNPSSEKHLANLTGLKSLKLIGSENSNQLVFLEKLVNLEELQITIPGKVDLTCLSKLFKLNKLNIWLREESNLEILKKITKLEDLSLTTSITDMNFIQDLNNLKNLRMNGFFKTVRLEKLPLLTTLSIEDCKDLVNINLSELPLLKKLSLKGTGCNCEMKNLPNLVEFDMGSCYLNPANCEQVTKLAKLTIRHPFLWTNSSWLLKLPLESLNISNSKICKLSSLESLPFLRELNISNCRKLSDEDLHPLLNCNTLQTLIVGDRVLPETFKQALKKKNIKVA